MVKVTLKGGVVKEFDQNVTIADCPVLGRRPG